MQSSNKFCLDAPSEYSSYKHVHFTDILNSQKRIKYTMYIVYRPLN
jgi:hypothetical protein